MKELEAIQKRSKTAGASAAKSAPMGKQKQIIDNLKQKLDDTKKQIMVWEGGWSYPFCCNCQPLAGSLIFTPGYQNGNN